MSDWRSDVLKFWFGLDPKQWWRSDPELDHRIKEDFLKLWAERRQLPVDAFTGDSLTALAAVVLFDQFPRNLFRGDARTYATDPLARAVANRALKRGYDQDVPDELRDFFFLPFMHSEDPVDQERCVQLYREAESADLKYAERHRDIIKRYGRFPHRNAILGRDTTPEEQKFLDEGGFKG